MTTLPENAREPFHLLAGAEASPVILHVPHSSRALPASVRDGILLDDDALAAELGRITDSHTAELATAAAGLCPSRLAVRQPAVQAGDRPGTFPR